MIRRVAATLRLSAFDKNRVGSSGSIGMAWLSSLGSFFISRSIDQDLARGGREFKKRAGLLIVCLGVCLRLAVYAKNHPWCFDEQSLWGNISERPVHEFTSSLTSDQLAPFGFLIAERAMVELFGASRFVGRLIPLVCGLASLLLFLPIAQKVVSRRAALIGLALFALSDDLIFFSSELKQYSMELAVAMLLSLGTLHAIAWPRPNRLVWFLAVGAIAAPWFSFSSAFIVAACGLALLLNALAARDWRDAAIWVAAGLLWAGSLVVAYNASLGVLSPNTSMYIFWDFAFLPIWPLPMSVQRTYKTIGILLEVFVNPLNMVHPLWVGVLLPLLTLLIGTYALALRSWRVWVVFVVPILLALFASSIRRYPFHGRLILELVPALFLLIAVGADRLGDSGGGAGALGYKLLLVLLLGYPCLNAVSHVAFRHARDFSPHGDLRRSVFLNFGEYAAGWPVRF